MNRIFKGVIVGFAAASMAGCLGHNALFNNVQDWNADLEGNKFVNQGVSFAFWIIPVYPLTLLADTIIFNSVEFWTGSNPISNSGARVTHVGADGSKIIEDDNGNVATITPLDGGRLHVSSIINGEPQEIVLVREGAFVRGYDAEGVMVGLAMHSDLVLF